MANGFVPISVNWHVWPKCNYSCKFCYATFKDRIEPLCKESAIQVPQLLSDAGASKLTFAGGEPLLCPHLGELLYASKEAGLTTMIVTNGSLINKEFLGRWHESIDWVAISIDSPHESTEIALCRGTGKHVAKAVESARLVRAYGIKLKVNVVVTSLNFRDDMSEIIGWLRPERLKFFQVLQIHGENDLYYKSLAITKPQFEEFVRRHIDLDPISEDNDAMEGSYLMLDPIARFFQNFHKKYAYSDSILRIGVVKALKQVGWDKQKFQKRGGEYVWK